MYYPSEKQKVLGLSLSIPVSAITSANTKQTFKITSSSSNLRSFLSSLTFFKRHPSNGVTMNGRERCG
jgi:hypothetical protein